MARPRRPVLLPGTTAHAIAALADAAGWLTIRVVPRSATASVGIEPDGTLVVRTPAAPSDGEANDAVLRLLAVALDCAPSALTLVRGATARTKRFAVNRDVLNALSTKAA